MAGMDALKALVKCEVLSFFLILFCLITYKFLTGEIKTRNLLCSGDNKRSFSPARVQLLLSTLVGAFSYLAEAFNAPGEFPALPPESILLVGGSNVLYAGAKAYSLLSGRLRTNNDGGT